MSLGQEVGDAMNRVGVAALSCAARRQRNRKGGGDPDKVLASGISGGGVGDGFKGGQSRLNARLAGDGDAFLLEAFNGRQEPGR